MMNRDQLLERITVNSGTVGGRPVIRGHQLAVERVLDMLAKGNGFETILENYPCLEQEDILACLVYAHRLVRHEGMEPLMAYR